jgi:hypothetical protein
MEMEMDVHEDLAERLTAAASRLEAAAERFAGQEISLAASAREAELSQQLAAAEATIASLKAGRKTLPSGVATLLAKDGSQVELGTLDAALVSLSLEQRIAVKAQLMRSGLIG